MKQSTLSSEIAELGKNQRNVAGNPSYVKVTCILMLAKSHSPSVISDNFEIDLSTVYRHVAHYQSKSVNGLSENRHKGYWGSLDSHQSSTLHKELREHIYTNAKSVAEWIKSAFGVEYTPQRDANQLSRIRFTIRRHRKSLARQTVPSRKPLFKKYKFLPNEGEIQASHQKFLRQY